MIPYKQLSLADIFSDCQEKFENDKPAFLSLLETHIDIDEIIPISFRNHFYASTGRTRKYPLQAFLWALIIQRIFSIPTDQLLLTFLALLKTSSWILRFYQSPGCFQNHAFQTGLFRWSAARIQSTCWYYRAHLSGHWFRKSRYDHLRFFRNWSICYRK